VRNVAALVAVGVSADGYREVLGVLGGAMEDKDCWAAFLRWLKGRGLKGVRLFVSDKCLGLVEALGEFYPEAAGSAAWSPSAATPSPWCPGARPGR
jgi:transposase-like protein